MRRARPLVLIGFATATALGLVGSIGLLITSLARSIELHSLAESSSSDLDIVSAVQRFYGRVIAGPAELHGSTLRHDYRDHANALPYPATFTLDLMSDLNDRDHGARFRLYSEEWFYRRPDSGPQDTFERDALEYFRTHPTATELRRLEETSSGSALRHAKPLRMEPACVACHNKHPDSPRKDWGVGDLRGVAALSRPIPPFSLWSKGKLGGSVHLLLGAVGVLVAVMLGSAILLIRRNHMLVAAKLQIEQLAYADTVTGLANRRQFLDRLADRLGDGQPAPFSLLLLDLERFKAINDLYGHGVGDEVLRTVASRLRGAIGPEFVLARLGGDEFAILVPGATAPEELERLARGLCDSLAQPINVEGKIVRTGASIGISRCPMDGVTARDLLAHADMAINRARISASAGWHLFTPDLTTAARHADAIADALHRALEDEELIVHYQPQLSLQDGRLAGLEALLRWEHPTRGLVPPGAFLEVAVERGLMVEIGARVQALVLADLVAWQRQGLPLVPVSINVHHDEIQDPEHLAKLEALIAGSGIARTLITLEVNEGCLLGRGASHAAGILASWASSGVGVSLDHFGTGLAALTHLKDLRIDELKIDRSFVRELEQDPDNRAIVRAVVDLAQALSITVVAEGIETAEQARLLRAMGCPLGQGYLFSKPVPPARAEEMLGAAARLRAEQPVTRTEIGSIIGQGTKGRQSAAPLLPALALQD